MNQADATHSALVGYIIWIFGFLGSHRFYFGKQITGVSEINRRDMLVGR